MARSWSARAAHLRAEVECLSLLKTRMEALQHERSAADEALRVAQQHADDVAAQQTQLEKRLRTMKASVRSARASYVQQVLSTLPEDVLCCIFEALVNLPDSLWEKFGYGVFNSERAASPFALAAVCSRWRRVALRCPTIWTYIGFPGPDLAEAHLPRITTILARSSPCGIDVLTDNAWDDHETAASNDPFEMFIGKITTHAHRWRAIELWLPKLLDGPSLFAALRGPLPLLKCLSLCRPDDIELPAVVVEKGEGFLPYAPNLQCLEVAIQGLDVADIYHPGLPSLRFLRTWSCCTDNNASRLLRLGQDTLSHIDICGSDDIAPFPLPFPNVESICVRGYAFFIDWPQPGSIFTHLKRLSLSSDAMSAGIAEFLTGVAAKVAHLELFGDVTIAVIGIAQNAANITHLSLAEPGTLNECHIADDIFAHIADGEPCIWPRLTSVRVAAATTLDAGAIEGVLRLINKRNTGRTRGVTDDTTPELPARISEVVIEGKKHLKWLKAEITRLLACPEAAPIS